MATEVADYPVGYNHAGAAGFNHDPGVYEPECDWREDMPAYPDTKQFLEAQAMFQQQQQEAEEVQQAQQQHQLEPEQPQQPQEATVTADLPLKGDYQGLGGPQTVPLYSSKAFERPEPPKENSILTQIFMEPTDRQLRAYNRVLLKEQVGQNKYRLKWTIFIHHLLFFVMLIKLMPEILDIMDIFILEVEELFVPKPYLWEYVWVLSVPITFFGLSACAKNNMISIRRFMLGSIMVALLPVLIGMAMHASQMYTFLFTEDSEIDGEGEDSEGATKTEEDSADRSQSGQDDEEESEIFMWQGYPYSVLWYAFFFLALQVHCYELYFANCLMKVWMPTPKKTQ